jgi:hypothetical protein
MNSKNVVSVSKQIAMIFVVVLLIGAPVSAVNAEGWDSYDLGGDMGGYDYGFEDSWSNDQYYEDSWSNDEYYQDEWSNDEYYQDDWYDDEYYQDDWYDDEYYQDDYGYSGGGSSGGGSYGGGSMGCYWCGGGTTFKPTPVKPVTVSHPQYPVITTPTTVTNNNTNNNTNVNVNNNTAIAVAQVQIGSQQTSYPTTPTYPAPYCTINQAQYGSYNNYGTNQVYLSWNSTNASSAYLSGYGSVAVNGSQTVYTSYTQTYTLTVYGYNGQQATCQTTVNVNTYVPPTPYVSLTQIPYTGFDFGPFGNAMYWAGMIVFALAGAYLAVYYVPSLAFAGTKRAYAPVVAPKAPILVEKEAALANVAPIVASLRKAGTADAMAIVKSVDGSMPKIVIERF